MSNPSGRRRVRDHIPAEDLPEYTASLPSQIELKDAGWVAGGGASARLELIDDILARAGQAFYQWDVKSDNFTWGNDVRSILNLVRDLTIESHEDLLRHIGPEGAFKRARAIQDSVAACRTESAPFSVVYKFRPDPWDHENYIWIEERGCAFVNAENNALATRGILRIVTDQQRHLQDLKFRATHDQLTGQLNRSQLIEEMEATISSSIKSKTTSIFLLAAIDNLEFINETYGYDIGDQVLAVIGKRFASTLRPDGCVGRHTANKFGILLNDCGHEAMQHVANRLLDIVRSAPIDVADTTLGVTLAIGGVIIPDQAATVQETLSLAHDALDQARIGHQNKFMLFHSSAIDASKRSQSKMTADDIIASLNENRMVLALQPIVSVNTGEPEFYECLVRMIGVDGELISAAEIVPLAERLGLMGYLDHRVLEMAVEFLADDPRLNLSLNVSGQTTSDHDWLIALHSLTQGRQDIRNRMIIEITETSAIRDLDETVNFVDTLHDLGCRVAIDDFGAGYTSFQNLRFFGVDMVKIDGSFMRNITSDPENLMFVETLIDLAKKFGLDTVVEWVGDEDTAKLMRAAGVDFLQGSLYGMPAIRSLPTEQFSKKAEQGSLSDHI